MRYRMILLPVVVALIAAGCLSDGETEQTRKGDSATEAKVCAPLPPKTASWMYKYESKLWINGAGFNAATCAIPFFSIPGASAGHRAAYKAFCKLTGRKFRDTAATPNPFPPGQANLDARVYGRSDVSFTCTQGIGIPTAGTATAWGSRGGFEQWPNIFGTDNVATRNSIPFNGSWGMVTWGRPNLLLEPAFQAIQPRTQPNIWNNFQETISCNNGAGGVQSATFASTLTSTLFPSDKLWRTNTGGPAPGAPVLVHSHGQGAMFALWSLPAVPAP